MGEQVDISQIISNDFKELIQKGEDKALKNDDFTKAWRDLVMLPLYRIEYIIQTSLNTEKGYNKDEAVIYGFLMRIYKMLCFQRRLVCNRIMSSEIASFFERMLLEDIINFEYYILNYKNSILNFSV